MKKTFRLSDARPDPAADTRDEIDFHLDMLTRELIARGMAPDAARRAALASFGDVEGVEAWMAESRQERSRRRGRFEWWAGALRDARYAIRSFRRRPLYAAGVISALALGISAAGAVFAVVDGVLLRPLPYRAPDRLAMVWLEAPPSMGGDQWPVSAGFYQEFREARSFAALAALRSRPVTLGDVAEVERLQAARVTPSLFTTLGVAPRLGRSFTEAEGEEGAGQVAILSHSLWQTRFGADPAVIGRRITLSGDRFEVIGVMPAGFSFPRGAELMRGLAFGVRTDLWLPLAFSPADRQNYGTQNLAVVGRLADGVSAEQARAELGTTVSRVLAAAGATFEMGTQVVSLKEQAALPVRRGLLILLGAVAAVLLIACANVAGLLAARIAERHRELAVRLALGARRPRVARQLVTEMMVLALVGGALGAVGTWWGTRLLLALAPADLPRADDVGFGLAVAAAIAAVVLLSGAAFGVVAIRGLAVASPEHSLQGGAGRTTAGGGARLGRRLLVAGQVAVSVLLLIGAGLLLQSFRRIGSVQPGFVADQTLTGHVALPLTGEFDPRKDGPGWVRFFEELVSRVRSLPGVETVGAVSALPLTGEAEGGTFVIVGQPPPRLEDRPRTAYLVAAGDYFGAAGIRVLAGRGLAADRADGPRVAVVSRSLAERYFPGEDPIGREVLCSFEFSADPAPRRIVGVVADVKLGGLDDEDRPTIYVPQSQMSYPFLSLVIRASGESDVVLAGLRRELKELNSAAAVSDVRSLERLLSRSLARQRFTLTLIGGFAISALLLAVLGLYGVIAITVEARRRELGVRMALGARPGELVRMVVGEGMRLVAAGAATGLLGALAMAGALRSLLYGVGERDAAVYAGAAAVVTVVALVATWLPARAAVRASPTEALRVD